MKYKNIKKGTFISRPNRFIAQVNIDGTDEICHVKNTGRCKELFVPGAEVFVTESDNPLRKTRFDLVCVRKGDALINVDSQMPNKVFSEWAANSGFFGEITLLKPECKYKNSRFDFYIESGNRKIFIEVKGVTLENDGIAMFPDAPTERGLKHVVELCESIREGFEAYIFFIVKMKNIKSFTPNRKTHPEFADALKNAEGCGVKIKCLDCIVMPDSLKADSFIPVRL